MRRDEMVNMNLEKVENSQPRRPGQQGSEENKSSQVLVDSSSFSSTLNFAYVEMEDVPVRVIDPVAEVEKNLAHLQELQDRLRFLMKEVRYQMKI